MYKTIKSYKPQLLFTLLLVGIILISASKIFAQDLPPKPSTPKLLVDYAGVLNSAERSALEGKLVHFNDTTSNQILIVITDNLLGNTIEEYASGIGDSWGVGQANFDNGIVITVLPKIGNNRGLAFIAVGYGLEGAIPDITSGQIVDYEMIPYFKKNDYYGGLDAATTVLMELAVGEYNSDEYAKSRKAGLWKFSPLLIFIIIYLLISRMSRRSRTIGGRGVSPWAAFWLGSMMGGSGSSSGWGGSSGSGFGGGGGFGGFGGGGFGGGGAGGSW